MVYHPKITLEKLTLEDDLTGIIELSKTFPEPNYDRKDFEKRLRDKKYWIYAAKYEGKEVSFAAFYESKPGEIYYWLTATSDEHRKIGLAAKLFDFSLNISKQWGYKKIKLKTFDKSRGMINLCKKRGFRLISVKPNKWGNNNVELVFDLDLSKWNPPARPKKYNLRAMASMENTGIYSVCDTDFNRANNGGIIIDTYEL